MKICSKCGITKSDEAFGFKNQAKGIRTSYCLDCQKVYSKAHYQKNKARYIRKAKTAALANRDYIRRLKEETPCKDCGKQYAYYVMQFDHQGDKSFMIANSWHKGRSILLAEIAKCDIVCGNCHAIRTHASVSEQPSKLVNRNWNDAGSSPVRSTT